MTTQRHRQDPTRSAEPVADGEVAAELKRLRQENAQLHHALHSRPVIDQARGMIMAVGRCTPEQAWDVLVTVSQHSNTRLRLVAQQLVATTAGHSLPAPIRRALAHSLRIRHRP
ncbi:ANTAR domain-containing protein [Streptomyces coelicoflavus]|uniref:ANTAR domain-containing protein n=1 Tax=Streptomyces coelicoflavus TaxID=285562 RepID=UPI0036AAA41F